MPELMRRYVVMPMATEAPFDTADPDGVFVLKPWKDPAALRALGAYAEHCYPELARDLQAWIRAIERGPAVRGDVGQRNDDHLRAARKPRARRPARAAKKRPARTHTAARKTPRRRR